MKDIDGQTIHVGDVVQLTYESHPTSNLIITKVVAIHQSVVEVAFKNSYNSTGSHYPEYIRCLFYRKPTNKE